jgi:hypothetical protein
MRAHCKRAEHACARFIAVRFASRFMLRVTKNGATARRISIGTLGA